MANLRTDGKEEFPKNLIPPLSKSKSDRVPTYKQKVNEEMRSNRRSSIPSSPTRGIYYTAKNNHDSGVDKMMPNIPSKDTSNLLELKDKSVIIKKKCAHWFFTHNS